jgi:hypothetical protein
MGANTERARRLYGAHPLHLLTLVASFAIVGYVISLLGVHSLWNDRVWWQSIIVWFLGAIVLHDLVLFPFYALADRSLGAGWRSVTGRAPQATPAVSPRNYLRIPVMASGLLFLLFFPGIIRQGSASYHRATGLTQQPFLGRWLLLTGAFFGVSAIAYAARTVQVRRHHNASVVDEAAALSADGSNPAEAGATSSTAVGPAGGEPTS